MKYTLENLWLEDGLWYGTVVKTVRKFPFLRRTLVVFKVTRDAETRRWVAESEPEFRAAECNPDPRHIVRLLQLAGLDGWSYYEMSSQ